MTSRLCRAIKEKKAWQDEIYRCTGSSPHSCVSPPPISTIKTPASGDAPATRETDFSVDVSKRITENLGIGFGATYKQLRPDQGDTQRGFDNLAAHIKYKFYQNDEHE